MADDKAKKGMGLIIALGGKPKKAEPAEDEGGGSTKTVAAQALIDALGVTADAEEVADAMTSLVAACKPDEY
jgi:hypothetical protein